MHNVILIIIINLIDEVLCCEGPTPLVVLPGPNIWCYAPANIKHVLYALTGWNLSQKLKKAFIHHTLCDFL